METYFKWKLISEFIVPLMFLLSFILVSIYTYIKNQRKARLMKKLGYTYNYKGGPKAAYEFQPHWEKGNIKINCRRIERMEYVKIRDYVHSQEKTKSIL